MKITTNGGTTWNDFILSNARSNTPARAFGPYIGDYTGLTAAGKDFFGVFSANNTPNNANFPQGVTYQRNANFATNTLLNGAGTTAVSVSIDPFFFHVRNQNEDDDFYVRDWTDSTTVNDTGIEPSTDPWFFSTSDVWNRRSNAPGGFDAADRRAENAANHSGDLRTDGKILVDHITPSWLIYADGFQSNTTSLLRKRAFDLVTSFLLLMATWPIMLLTVIAIWIEEGFRAPIFYHQIRVGKLVATLF